jgi:hypothetical protein
MKMNIFLCLLLITSGCTVFQPVETTLIQPKLLKQVELPPIRELIYNNYFEFYCEMLINANGDVERAKLLTGTDDEVWDSLAALSLLEWKYTPAIYDGHPIKLVIYRKIKVVFEDPKIYSLAEIQLQNYNQADSVYNALLDGIDFALLAHNCSISDSKILNGNLGNVNINHFSEDIRIALANLDEGEFTEPLVYGDHFVIYKRLSLNN